jgi:hypothetical protein
MCVVQQPEFKPALPHWADVQYKPQAARQVQVGGLQAMQGKRPKLTPSVALSMCTDVCLCSDEAHRRLFSVGRRHQHKAVIHTHQCHTPAESVTLHWHV